MIIDLPLKIDVLKKSEANLHTILDNADTGYVLYNAQLTIIAYSALAQQFAHLLYNKQLEEGCHLLQYFPEYRHRDLLDITEKVLSGEKVCYESCFIVDNAEVWIEVCWLNIKNEGNKNWGFILTSKDITESKLAAIKVEKITQDLFNRNKALEQFGNIVSHNLRAPVANIINIVQMIDTADTEGEKKILLDFILSSSQTLIKVIGDINQILEIKQHLHEVKEKIFLEPLLNEIKTTINYMIIKDNVIISSDFNDVPYIYSTRSFIYSIYYNLVLNSIKYRREDVTPEIDLSAKVSADKIILKFTDNGKGIDLCRHGHNLFGLYKRFDTSVEGSGLGLFMIRTQIEQLGGSIDVESELGKGTTFTIELPV
jgi:signal transduction histidine kinase